MTFRRAVVRARAFVFAFAVVTAIAVVPVAGSTGRYVDARNDARTAPDITEVTVGSDATGQVVFTIGVTALPTEGDVGVALLLDTDLNGGTGRPESGGADFIFVEDPVAKLWNFGRWTGTEWDWETPYSTVRVWSSPTGVTISVNRSELGNSSGFNFWAYSWLADDADDAPDVGLWNYSLAADGPEIRRVLLTTSPRTGPKAGKRFTLVPAGLELPPSAQPPLLVPRPDSYSCRAKLAGRALAGSGTGRCSWLVPRTARRQKLMIVVTVAFGGAAKAFTFSYRVT